MLRASDHISRFREAFQAKKKEGLSSDDAMQACAVLAAEAGRTHIESTIFRYLCQVLLILIFHIIVHFFKKKINSYKNK